jgi:large subunit ribosomal protein L24
MHVRKGDNVIVIAGKDRGTVGTIIKSMPKEHMVVMTGVNIKKKHAKGRRSDQKGQILDIPHPIHASNVMIVDPDSKKRSRVGKKFQGDSFVRVAKKSGKTL